MKSTNRGVAPRIRMASRILGMGDVLTLVEKAERSVDQEEAAKAAAAVLAASDSRPLFWHTLSATMPPVRAMPALPAAFAQYLES